MTQLEKARGGAKVGDLLDVHPSHDPGSYRVGCQDEPA